MIRCPRCGSAAQWGAPQCPNCGVQFVAPPSAGPPPAMTASDPTQPPNAFAPSVVASGGQSVPPHAGSSLLPANGPIQDREGWAADVFRPEPSPQTPWWIVVGGVAVFFALVALLFAVWPRGRAKNGGKTGSAFAGNSVQVKAPPSMAGSSESNGVFVEQKQAQRQPVITIGNDTSDDLRLTMRDVQGITQSATIPAFSDKDFPVPQGDYDAMIDAPTDHLLMPTKGAVRVKDYHHYNATFVIVDSSVPQSFYIGD